MRRSTTRSVVALVAVGLWAACGGTGESTVSVENPPPGTPSGPATPVEPPPPPPVIVKRRELAWPAVQPKLEQLQLVMSDADSARLHDPANLHTNLWVPAQVTLDGQSAPGQVRLRGASTREAPQKSYKVKLDPGYHLSGRDHFELLAEYYDAGKLSEKFAVDLFEALGLWVPRARFAWVGITGRSPGLYLDMESVGTGEFLDDHGLEAQATVWRCGDRNCELTLRPGPYQGDWEKKTNESDPGRTDLDAFLKWVNRTDDARFEAEVASRIDLDAYLGNLVGDLLISNFLVEDSKSYWIYEPTKARWVYVPWDLNNARLVYWRNWTPWDYPPETDRAPFGFSAYDPGVQSLYEHRLGENAKQRPTWSVLNTRLWDRPALRERIVAQLQAALDGPFREDLAHAHVDALWQLIQPALEKDVNVDPKYAARAPAFLKQYVSERRRFLQAHLDALRSHGNDALVVRALTQGSSGWVEVENRGRTSLPLDGWRLTNDLRQPDLYRIPQGTTLAPGARRRFLLNVELPFGLSSSSGGELGLFPPSDTTPSCVWGPSDVVYFGPAASGATLVRSGEDWTRP